MLTPQERRLQLLLRVLSLIFGLAIFGYLLPALGIFGREAQRFSVNLPFVTNSVVKIGTLALLAFLASADVRRYRVLTVVIIAGHVISEVAVAAVLLWGDLSEPVQGLSIPITTVLYGSMIADGVIIILLVSFSRSAVRAGLNLFYFSPMQFRSLKALAEVVITDPKQLVPPDQVARNVDRYLAGFRGRTKWIMKLVMTGMQLYPLLSLHAPLSYMQRDERYAFLTRRFYQDVTARVAPPFWRMIVQGMIRMAKQLSFLGYYNDERTFASVGYVRFSDRTGVSERFAQCPPPERKPLRVYRPAEITTETLESDVVVIGSGAAASILSYGLAKAGRQVLMLERGDFVDPTQFTDNEVDMLSRLYADGALQLSQDFRFQVLQGSCVGGTTVVNNAVCFDLPDPVLQRWNDPASLNAGLDPDRLAASFAEVRKFVGVERQKPDQLNRGAKYFLKGIDAMQIGQVPNDANAVEANIHCCLGCGYCNIGCRYGRKLSMLDTVLPNTQEEFGTESLKIVSDCEALRLYGSGGNITHVRCRLGDNRRIDVKGKTVVIAAGAISSSMLLLRSGIAVSRAGRRLSFNMGSPMTAVFDEVVNAYDGLQISHYLRLNPTRGYVFETWFNPPVSQALTMPGWFKDHFTNMQRYNRMMCTGVLVGTESNGQVRRAGLTGREVDFDPTPDDLSTLVDGLVLAGQIYFAAGAKAVIPNTFKYYEFKTPEELQKLPDLVKDASDITLGTGHPQGGNVMSQNPALGVINNEFRVYGYNNLFLCDASVFPSSIGVNPQLTVMSLAHYAVPFVASNH